MCSFFRRTVSEDFSRKDSNWSQESGLESYVQHTKAQTPEVYKVIRAVVLIYCSLTQGFLYSISAIISSFVYVGKEKEDITAYTGCPMR
jgi:hypothetical protein